MAGTSWPTLTAGAIARASDVNAHFAWLEGHLVPMSGGASTDLVFDLGTSTTRWNFGYIDKLVCHNINPTTTSKCVVFGTTSACTTTADSDASVEFAGARGLILPRLSTTQIANLTSVDGMLVFNTTTSQLQVRRNGTWVNQGATVYKAQIAVVSTASGSTQTALNITGGGGRINGIFFKVSGTERPSVIGLILDGTTIVATTGAAAMTGAGHHIFINGAGMLVGMSVSAGDSATVTSTQALWGDVRSAPLGTFDFASTAAVYFGSLGGATVTAVISYSIIQ